VAHWREHVLYETERRRGPLSRGIGRTFIVRSLPPAIVVEMAEGKGTPTSQWEKEPDKRPLWWKRLWARTGVGDKTLWDLLQLLVVPLALAVIGFWFAAQQDQRQQHIEKQRAEAERELAVQRAQDEALQAYLDQMSGLLLERDLRASEKGSEVRTLARARTLTVLPRLDGDRKGTVVQFLVEAELVQRGEGGREPIIRLGRADLSGAFLFEANLSGADLSGADLSKADLTGADLRDANLSCGDPRDFTGYCADLSGAYLDLADLSGANLNGASLNDASLTRADLSGADLSNGAVLRNAKLTRADLSGADLSLSDLSDANLTRADLSEAVLNGTDFSRATLIEADLTGANLQVADITQKQLEQAGSLEGAIMPNGSAYRQEGP
jgi:uncharacterized protein YjbI with pentapeptide repeats